MKELKLRQICFIFLAFAPITKVIIMPSILARYSRNDLWISSLINFFIDILLLLYIFLVIKKNKNQSLFELLENSVGKTASKIIIFTYAIYFFAKPLVLMLEQKYFVDNTFYETKPNVINFLPIFIIVIFACAKGLRSIGRCADIMIWFTYISFFGFMLLAVGEIDLTELLPVAYGNVGGIFKGSGQTLIWYGDSVYLLFFMGKFKNEKKQLLKLVLSYLIVAISVAIFLAVFYSVFSSIAVRQLRAVAQISKYSLVLSDVGRFDFVALFLMTCSCIYALSLPYVICTDCVIYVFNIKKRLPPALIISAITIILILIFERYFSFLLSITKDYLIYFYVGWGYILPLLTIFLKPGKKQKTFLCDKKTLNLGENNAKI